MAEYISREAAIKRLYGWQKVIESTYGKNDEYAICLEEAIDKIEDLPAADVWEATRGKWIKENIVLTTDPPQYRWHCSECGVIKYWFDDSVLTNFCPNCGAKMGEHFEKESNHV